MIAGAGRRGRLLDRTRSPRTCGRLGMPARPARRPRAAGPGWWTLTCRAGHAARRARVLAPVDDQLPEDLARDRRGRPPPAGRRVRAPFADHVPEDPARDRRRRRPPRPAARSHQVAQDLRPPRH
ncbi:hypothetical protein, partial [Paracidovorax citrulli]|uniref:hypothetical protein n=1 Tax=Paracidovorax citrulli TaxID=80869 RepID=UPI003FA72AFA